MTERDSESRRQRLRDLQEKHKSRDAAEQAAHDDGDDNMVRLRRGLAERQRRRAGNAEEGQRLLERFPRLREALAKRRQSSEWGGRDRSGGRFQGHRRRAGEADTEGDALLFARRYVDADESVEADDDIHSSLERLGKRAEMLMSELFETLKQIEELDQLRQVQEADSHKTGDNEAPDT